MQVQVTAFRLLSADGTWTILRSVATAGDPRLPAAACHLICKPLSAQCPLTLLPCKSG